ncbi:DUF2505 domain-containing protein [Mycobacterium talmoniae]|uniref:DUF2505 domain-containing protein n=1 Tax=Mycobacterium talmoniae TaxID=1858794 RepID=A0A1S1NKZ6_9MYCO|nr:MULTISPECIES: DUF2505 domain-containing protein [Mycobacterium]OHV04525.1 hypothetical protein BKN37_09510 [Mycobacterium talmoniae]PQM44279.1 hypothetical protein C1Y40_05563 [Mycobacterium talmoniae]TDH57687.1 DUF2505 domain-containing protein [Mycobacterium eburneum]
MPRSIDLSAESPASVEQFHSAFSSEAYWRARLAVNDSGPATLDTLTVDADDTVRVVMTLTPLRDRLPRMVTQLHHGALQIRHTETWRRGANGRVHGEIGFVLRGAPLSGLGLVELVPANTGSQLTCTATVEVRVPLLGGTVERFIGGQLPDGILAAQRFTTEWIAQSGSRAAVPGSAGRPSTGRRQEGTAP